MRNLNETALSAIALTADRTSTAIDAKCLVAASVQAVITGGSSPTGTIKLQCSNDGTNWSDVPNASAAVTDNGTFIIGKADLCYLWVRVKYSFTSGTGTMTARFQGFGF